MTELVRKNELDGRVAELLGKKRRDVSLITEAFLHEVVKALVEAGEVRLDGLGKMRVQCRRGQRGATAALTQGHGHKKGPAGTKVVSVERKYYVSFSRSTRLKEALWDRFGRNKRNVMEKFAVDENVDGEDLEKKAAEGCPKCGAKCTRHGNILMCPTHGSEPFEQPKK